MTIAIAAICSIIVILVRPFYGLLIFYGALVWYPSTNIVDLAGLNFSVSRIVGLVLLIKVFFDPVLRAQYSRKVIDIVIIIFFTTQIGAGATTSLNFTDLLINRFGTLCDTFIPFILVRFILIDRKTLLTFIKYIVLITAPLGIMAGLESVLRLDFLSFGRGPLSMDPRWGMARARAAFSHPIYFGVSMALIFGLSLSILKYTSKTIYKLSAICIFAGVFFSLSSGAWLPAVAIIFFVKLFKYRIQWKAILLVIGLLCLGVEFFSNRHFYQVIDRVAMNAKTAWYRNRLIEVAFFEGGMSGHWLFGYGHGVDPMWGKRIDNRGHTDMVNHYLLILSQFGLAGLIPYMCICGLSIKHVYEKIFKVTLAHSWLMWCIGASVLGLLLAIFSVSLFGQGITIMFVLFGLATNVDLTAIPVQIQPDINRQMLWDK